MAKPEFLITPELQQALEVALNKQTLTEALASIALWEHLRMNQDIRNGVAVANYFTEVIDIVMKAYIWTPRTAGHVRLDPTVIQLPKID